MKIVRYVGFLLCSASFMQGKTSNQDIAALFAAASMYDTRLEQSSVDDLLAAKNRAIAGGNAGETRVLTEAWYEKKRSFFQRHYRLTTIAIPFALFVGSLVLRIWSQGLLGKNSLLASNEIAMNNMSIQDVPNSVGGGSE